MKFGLGVYQIMERMSLPSRERGLKFYSKIINDHLSRVAPLAGAWIEISFGSSLQSTRFASLPSRERGLKLMQTDEVHMDYPGRSPRGSVD